MHNVLRGLRVATAVVASAALVSCGGSNSASSGVMAQACSSNNPYRGDASAPTSVGSIASEKTWLRDYVDRKYLWYNEVPNVNAAAPAYSNDTVSGFYTSIDNYFNALLTPAHTASGKLKDQFSFSYPTAAWDALINGGASTGWGIEWHFDTIDRDTATMTGIRVAFVHSGSPAANVDLRRGDRLVSIAGLPASAVNDAAAYNALLDRLFPPSGQSVEFVIDRNGTQLTKTPTSSVVALTPTLYKTIAVGAQNVGYLLFNDHLLTAESRLIDAVKQMQADGVSDLVLDLRYNGGGYLYIASQMAYMIAGGPPRPTLASQAFETTLFNNKRSSENATTTFFDAACLPNPTTFQCTSSAALPTLGLSRVYVLTSGSTCSASEAIINGLRGVNVDVRLIGNTTCGKPYGFFGQDNCGITYFPIEFQGVNAMGFGAYADGFIPDSSGNAGNHVAGCPANDDLDHALGDPAEGQLAAALAYRASGNTTCPPLAAARQTPLAAGHAALAGEPRVVKPAVLTNRNGRMPTR